MTRGIRLMAQAQILICVVILGTFCGAYRAQAPTDIPIQSANTKKIPLRAALYVKPEYRNFIITYSLPIDVNPINYLLGESFMIGTKKILDVLFRDVSVMMSMSKETTLPDIDVIVIPDIVEGKIYSIARNRYVARIGVKWTILDTRYKEIYINTFIGETAVKMGMAISDKRLCRTMDSSVLEVYKKSAEGLSAVEWWKDINK